MNYQLTEDQRATIVRLVNEEHGQLSQFWDRAHSGKLDRMLIHLEDILEVLALEGQPV